MSLTREDEWIDGKFLPRGTTLILNTWGLHRDPERFPSPDVFDPDHYLGVTKLASELATAANAEERDHYGYGAGRRLCPGIHLAERNLFLGISKLLWAFEILPGKNERGERMESGSVDVDPVTAYSEGFLTCPRPFACEMLVRGGGRRETILREFAKAEEDIFKRYE